jgi:glucose-6-phosphate 1-dehydrogenase
LLQVVALLAMEPPIADHADAYRDEELKILRQIEPLDPTNTVRGQYVGYLDEPGVAKDSTTETFVSTRLAIQSWRWAGVPFHVRTGKCMPGGSTEAVIELHRPPRLLFAGQNAALPEANLIRFRLGHNDGLTMSLQAKAPGVQTVTQPVDLNVDFADALGHRQEAYERLLDDAMDGRRHRFAREDTIEEEWRIVEPILDHTDRPSPYYKGTWGPSGAEKLTGGWHDVSVQGPAGGGDFADQVPDRTQPLHRIVETAHRDQGVPVFVIVESDHRRSPWRTVSGSSLGVTKFPP